jgi:hypothetical protein
LTHMSALVPAQFLRGMLDAAQRENHDLPLRSAAFSPAQVGALKLALDTGLRRLAAGQFEPDPGSRLTLSRGGLLIRLMIDLGREVGQLAEFAHTWLQPDPSASPDSWGLVSWAKDHSVRHCWWLKPGPRGNKSILPSDGIMLAFLPETERWFELAHLPLVPAPGSVCTVTAVVKSARLFDRSEVEMHEDVAAFIRWAKGILGPRGALLNDLTSPATIAREQISWKRHGDRVLAERVTGKDSAHAKKFYTYMRFKNRKEYRTWVEARDKAELEKELAKELAVLAAWVEGDDKAIEPSALRRALLDFDWRIDRRKDIVVEHRRITVLLWLVLSVAVASRARRKPCPSPHAIDPRTGALLVLDKRTEKKKPQSESSVNLPPGERLGDARIVFLPRRVRLLIVAYHEHLRSLSKRADLLMRTRKRCASLARRLDEGLPIPFFELKLQDGTNRKSHAVLSPTAIAQHTSGMLDLLLERNFARHMLRGALIGQISHEVIDAQLGHWAQGVEPWSNGSALDPIMFRAMMSAVQAAFVSLENDGRASD